MGDATSPIAPAPDTRTRAVVVDGLTKRFPDAHKGEVRAVDGISFVCHTGEVLGLLGVNGAGKTTTLRMLSTVLTPTAGGGSIMGYDLVRQATQVRASIGFLSASTALYPRLTTRETLTFFARMSGVPRDHIPARVDALVARFDLKSFEKRRVEQLSSGMKQRLSIARTIVHDPAVLIFDEPTVGLDVLAARDLVDAVGELRGEGKALVYSTHIMAEAEKVCDRIAILHQGQILRCGTLAELRDDTSQHALEDIFVHYVRGPGG